VRVTRLSDDRRAVCDGASGVGHHGADPSQFLLTFRLLCSPSVYFLRKPVALLATYFLEQRHLCVTTMFVWILQTLLLVTRGCVGVFSARLQRIVPVVCVVWRVFEPYVFHIWYARVDESSKTICGAAAEEP